ncbi:CaiB/BaiF CoA transferase family protein [Bradyrhizobium iriomotense]|uniref:CaiB/BaiF CoA transferase family protein n=1 Tax=Bradyrhizobium iriomotense TaxID=441950 RepID=UPI001B8A6328|nr:CoA transferase [Bradyrhizobium iriomotense]MBR0781904.1 CoA transferase [Bradyrhizobium iriomotense]
MTGALAGKRIIDLSTVIAGPLCARILGDYGADVIKVEPPGGDPLRIAVPARSRKMSAYHLLLNRNKRSLALDLKKRDAIDVVRRLAAGADVLIHNMRPRALERLGLDYESLNRANPKLVCTNIIGFGRHGPYRDRPAYDDLIQAMSGIASLAARGKNGVPRYLPLNAVDRLTAVTAAHATLAALVRQERTGRGQEVEVPMYENAIEFMLGDHMTGALYDPPLGNIGNARAVSPARRPFPTKNGAICVIPFTDKHWLKFCEVTGRTDYQSDARFSSQEARAKNPEAVLDAMAAVLETRSTAEWLELFASSEIPHGPLHTLEDLLKDAHLKEVGFFVRRRHPTEGDMVVPRPAVWMSETPPSLARDAPIEGAATREILRESGYDDAEIERLIISGVAIEAAPQP